MPTSQAGAVADPWVWMLLLAVVGVLLLLVLGLFIALWRRQGATDAERREAAQSADGLSVAQRRLAAALQVQTQTLVHGLLQGLADRMGGQNERMAKDLRTEMAESSRGARAELGGHLTRFATHLTSQLGTIAQMQNQQIDGFAQQLARTTEQLTLQLAQMQEQTDRRLAELTLANEKRLAEIRGTLEAKILELQTDNAAKLEQMRATVDEKLQTTLESRLGESFRLVSERLEQVQRGLGEMQTLAAGVGDLKRVLTNVKTRGNWGEVQLGNLLEQMLTPEQYQANFAPRAGSGERVEFAIRLPGRFDLQHAPGAGAHDASGPGGTTAGGLESPVWLPIDAKFPREDYERLIDAADKADPEALEIAAKALEQRIRLEAKAIRDKYLVPPLTTDFGILFLPTEGLYAEVLRRPGLADQLQRDYRVMIAGPTTLTALLNSLQMGFRTLAIEKRSGEVWQLLGAVRTEFGKFAEILAKTRRQLEAVGNTLGDAESKTRTIERRLKRVEALPEPQAAQVLALQADDSPAPTAGQ